MNTRNRYVQHISWGGHGVLLFLLTFSDFWINAIETFGAEIECQIATIGGTEDNRHSAIFDPDEYAWQLFLSINRQASKKEPGVPDPAYQNIGTYKDDVPTVWETWALASGGRSGPFRRTVPNRSELYLDKGKKPMVWGTWTRNSMAPKHFEFFQANDPLSIPRASTVSDGHDGYHIMSDPSVIGEEQLGEEVRSNKCSYQFIVENELYNVEGIEKKVKEATNPRNPSRPVGATNPELISFPRSAQEVKAKWINLTGKEKSRYHWRTLEVLNPATGKTEKEIWGLAGFHITTKDLPNWFWATFEHIDTEIHAEYPSKDVTTQGTGTHGKDGVRTETVGSKWGYYRLRGTQTDFTTANRPTILANTQIEHGFQQSSSCITCHSRAAVGLRSNRPDLPPYQPNSLPVFLSSHEDGFIRYGPVGAPNPEWFRVDLARLRYIQMDFLWAIPFRANSIDEKLIAH